MELTEEAKQILRKIEFLRETWLAAEYGPVGGSRDLVAAGQIRMRAKNLVKDLELILGLHLHGAESVTIALAEADRLVDGISGVCSWLGECMRCNKNLERGHSTSFIKKGDEYRITSVICLDCSDEDKYQEYANTDIMTTGMITLASLDQSELERNPNLVVSNERCSLRHDVIQRIKKHREITARFMAAHDQIHLKMKEFEFKHWMGYCDEDVQALLTSYQEYDQFDWESATEADAKRVRDMWNPMDFGSEKSLWNKHWKPYHDRRSRPALQDLDGAYMSGKVGNVKVLMGGSAGRCLITISYIRGDAEGNYVSLIFDETAKHPRGGIQGIYATKDQALGLIQACIDHMPKLKPDSKVSIA